MATKVNPLKPFIFTINQTNLDAIEEEIGEYQNFYGQADRYYYYTVYRDDDTSKILYTGKTWSYMNDNGEVEVKVNIEEIVKAFMYDSYSSLKPVYNDDEQRHELIYVSNGGEVRPICSDKTHYERNGFGRTTFWVYLFAYADEVGRISNRICRMPRTITSSWNIDGLVYTVGDSYDWQNLLSLEHSGFVSHYPKIITDKFSVSWLMNVGNDFITANTPVYKFGNSMASGEYLTINSYNPSDNYGEDKGGYVAFNIKLSDIVPILQYGTVTPAVPFEQLNSVTPGASHHSISNYFSTGTSADYTPANIWIGGNATTQRVDIPAVNESNNIYIWSGITGLQPAVRQKRFKIGITDECISPYYLKWMTKSCVPVCWGFNGNTVRKSSNKQTYMKDIYRTEMLKIDEVTDKWELRSGIVDKTTYKVFEDIFTSPYVILYSCEKDEACYVKVDDSEFKLKNRVNEDKQPYSLTINISRADETKLIY